LQLCLTSAMNVPAGLVQVTWDERLIPQSISTSLVGKISPEYKTHPKRFYFASIAHARAIAEVCFRNKLRDS
jgi:hypothetical protein